MLRYVAGLAAVGLLAVGGAARADYEAGKNALEAGRPAEALSEWRAAASSGDRRAMLALGRLFLKGLGAPQDYVLAHMWLNLAASRGDAGAAKERNALSARMTPQQIAAAQDRARSWRPGTGGGAQANAPAPSRASAPLTKAGGLPPRAIREAQELLAALSYAPGPADGKWGGRTAAAHRAFLQASGLPAADALTPETLRALRKAVKGRSAAGTSRGAVRADAAARAASRGDVAGLRAAIAAAADVNARDARGRTALMYAANRGYVLLVPVLLEAKADPDLRAPDGATALFMATAQGHTGIVAQLMEAGADVSIRGPKGKTAVDAARLRYGDADAARKKGEDSAIVALLEGKTWADVEEERRTRELAENSNRIFREWREEFPRKKGVEIRDCDVCPEMVLVPSGEFTMGSPSSEKYRQDAEGPQRRVTIGSAFAVGKYEVTFAEWDACASSGGCGGYRPSDSGRGRGKRPVINVSWEDAQDYVDWLSRKTGKEYRLLSEAEWEYAARAGTRTRYSWGNGIGRNRANCYGCGSRWDDDKTAPVGSFGANGFGLHDMHGNVWEWVADCWNVGYAGAPSDGSAWESGNCGERVLRGGSWNFAPRSLRSASRFWNDIGFRNYNHGFRVARTLAP